MLIALLVLAAILAALGPAAQFLPPPATARAGPAIVLLAILVAVLGLSLPPQIVAIPGLTARFDGLSGALLLPVLIALLPPLLRAEPHAGPITGAAILLVLGDGALAALALVALWAVTGWRQLPVAIWAICAAAALLLAGLPDAATPLAAIGLGALWFGRASTPLMLAGAYVLARVGLMTALPVPWGLAVLGFGALGALLGGARAATSPSLSGALSAFAIASSGFGAAAIGVSMAARGADLLPSAAMGLEAAILLLSTQSLALAALDLAAHAVRGAIGTDLLAGFGGLSRSMRATALSALIAGASLALLPPSPGFIGMQMLLQAMFAAHRIGGVGAPFTLTLATAAIGLAVGLSALASVRLLGLTFAGAPSSPAASDPRGDLRFGMAGLAGLALLLALVPALPMLLALPALAGATLPVEPPSLLPTIVALLFIALCAIATLAMRALPAARRVPAWDGGSDTAPYLPGLAANLVPRARLRSPTLHELVQAATLALAVTLIVLAAR